MKHQKLVLMSLVLGLLAVVSFWTSEVKADSVSDAGQTGYYTTSNGYQYYVLNDGSYYYLENGQWIHVPAQEPETVSEDQLTEVIELSDEEEEQSNESAQPTMEDIYNCWCWPIVGRRQPPMARLSNHSF